MKCIAVVYIYSEELLLRIENLMEFYQLSVIESNPHFRVFQGHVRLGLKEFLNNINKQLSDEIFDIKDSIFLVYPSFAKGNKVSLSNIVIKRKGNKFLRKNK